MLNSNWSYRPETLGSKSSLFSRVTLKFEKNNRAPLLHYVKLCASFQSHGWNTQSGSKSAIFVPCDLDIWWRTLKNNRAPLIFYIKLGASFHSYRGMSGNAQFGPKLAIFLAMWPWNWTDDLEKQKDTSPKQCQAFCIISSPYVDLNWSYVPETAK